MNSRQLRAVIDLYTNGPLVLYNGAAGFISQQRAEYNHENTQTGSTCNPYPDRHVADAGRSVRGYRLPSLGGFW